MSLQRRFPKKNLDTSPILRRKYFLFYKYNGQIFKSLDFLETLPNIVGSYKFSMIRAISSASCQQCDGKKNNWIKTHIYNSSLPVCLRPVAVSAVMMTVSPWFLALSICTEHQAIISLSHLGYFSIMKCEREKILHIIL